MARTGSTTEHVKAEGLVDSTPALVSAAEDKPSKDRGGVQSLERAFGILEEVASHPDGLSLSELSKAVGLHNSTTFHLVRTMVQLGYARQSPNTKRYHIGRMVFTLAAGSLDEIELVTTATPVLDELARHTGESTHLALRSGDEVVVVARSAGSGAFQLINSAGGIRPAHATALGKVLFAALPADRLEKFLSETKLEPLTPKTVTDPDSLRSEFERVRQSGIAYDDGEYNLEVRCVAAPARDFTGRVVAAIGVSGPIWRVTLQRLPEISAKVTSAAESLSTALGARLRGN